MSKNASRGNTCNVVLKAFHQFLRIEQRGNEATVLGQLYHFLSFGNTNTNTNTNMSPKLKLSHQLQIYPSVSTDVSQWKIYRCRPVKIEEELNEKLTEKRLQQVANISAMLIWDKNWDEKLGLHPTILQQFPVALIMHLKRVLKFQRQMVQWIFVIRWVQISTWHQLRYQHDIIYVLLQFYWGVHIAKLSLHVKWPLPPPTSSELLQLLFFWPNLSNLSEEFPSTVSFLKQLQCVQYKYIFKVEA